MMGYYGDGFGWMWLWGLLLLIGIGVLVLLAVRLFTGGTSRGGPANYGPYGAPPYGQPGGPPGGKSQARLILDERFARGELTAEQYRENVKVLGEEP
ncbi:SHOCT domain-containing protein [Arthrobacter sp. U41]|uniref:SHOCT domain-containing protein n=1 Tax=Arthrobacter sp. U41 TaxID=1849032 RepID=UPI00119F3B81|nr:SHOCT domain-containing protein [Arthrobacter sp. U41]